jgi:hypothetical protein
MATVNLSPREYDYTLVLSASEAKALYAIIEGETAGDETLARLRMKHQAVYGVIQALGAVI